MIIENQNGKFYVSDDIMNDQSMTIQDIQSKAIPYAKGELMEEIKQLEIIKEPTQNQLLEFAKNNYTEYINYSNTIKKIEELNLLLINL